MKLLETAAADGPGAIFRVRETGAALFGTPLDGTAVVHGTWDGATVTLEAQVTAAAPWLPLPDAVFTEDGLGNVGLYAVALRAVVTDAGPGTSLTAELHSPQRSEAL